MQGTGAGCERREDAPNHACEDGDMAPPALASLVRSAYCGALNAYGSAASGILPRATRGPRWRFTDGCASAGRGRQAAGMNAKEGSSSGFASAVSCAASSSAALRGGPHRRASPRQAACHHFPSSSFLTASTVLNLSHLPLRRGHCSWRGGVCVPPITTVCWYGGPRFHP